MGFGGVQGQSGSEDERRNDLVSFLRDDEMGVLMVMLMSMFVDGVQFPLQLGRWQLAIVLGLSAFQQG